MIVFDIETGPSSWEEIEKFYEPPTKLAPFDSSSVKCGNLGQDKAKEKVEKARQEHERLLANEKTMRELHRQEWLARTALSPLTGQILAIGFFSSGFSLNIENKKIHCESERAAIQEFWLVYDMAKINRNSMVGFNIFGFDLPFIVRRSWFLDIDIPPELFLGGSRWNQIFIDLMTVWSLGNRQQTISLDDAARFFGVGGKPEGIGGGDFARLFANPETKQQAIDYLKNDLEMTWAVARKMGVC